MTALFGRLPDVAPLEEAAARALMDDCLSAAQAENCDQAVALLSEHWSFFAWLVEGSPFLCRLLKNYPDVLDALASQTPDTYFDRQIADAIAAMETATGRDAAMAILRRARNRLALTIALADCANFWDVEAVTSALSRFADKAVSLALDFLLREAVTAGRLPDFGRDGLVVLALGKHGGQELNYSSDIDFVVYYTPDALPLADGQDERKFYISLVRDLAAMLQNPTADGYVFRVDLRLRPDPGATQVCISVPAALAYYESMGQNWERAVYIKARPIAGDMAAGAAFLDELTPYIWRRYYDFAAIEDVHSMKRQIHAVRGHGALATRGHNLKLGRGGIREIEFFVQTQQLIAGGRNQDLRGHRTVDMLQALASAQWVSQETAQGMTEAYYFLRRLEHRLQMRLDEQTQTLPVEEDSLTGFARFAGYDGLADFEQALHKTLAYVTGEYALLFESSESLADSTGNLVFTGGEDDPETLETLSQMGFARPELISTQIRAWHSGRLRATRSSRAREGLTRLQPLLLRALARAADPDESFVRFDNFLQALPAGVQLFAMFQSNPQLLDLLVDVVSLAPRLSSWLGRNPQFVDMVMSGQDADAGALADLVSAETGFDAVMDKARAFVHEQHFRLGVQLLADPACAPLAGARFTALAEQCLNALHPAALADIERQYGRIDEAQMLVLGLGKLGSGEMALQSDLDIIIMCDCADFAAQSTGAKSIAADVWFARAARRLISGLTAPTAEGLLYEVDMRLRPSGNAGPMVTKLPSFVAYQKADAWTWEHMALTRARCLAGPSELADKVKAQIAEILTRPRDLRQLCADVTDMRAKIIDHQKPAGPFDIRRGAGGLVDIEFVCQTLQLAHGAHHAELAAPMPLPDLLTLLRDSRVLDVAAHAPLAAAADTYGRLRQIASLAIEDHEAELGAAREHLLLKTLNEPDMARLRDRLTQHRQEVEGVFQRVLTDLADRPAN